MKRSVKRKWKGRGRRRFLSDLVDNEALLKAVEQQPMLYITDHHNYRDLALKEAAWEFIADQLECTVELAKMKYKNLRGRYTKYLRHVAECKVARKEYNVWRYAQTMSFLRPYTMKMIIDGVTDSTDDELACYDSTSPKKSNQKPKSNDFDEDDGIQISDNDDDLDEDEFDESLASSDNQPTSTTSPEDTCYANGLNLDADDLIFLGYARTIKNLSPDKRSLAKFKIAEVIMKIETGSDGVATTNGRTRKLTH